LDEPSENPSVNSQSTPEKQERICPFCCSATIAERFEARELIVGTREAYAYCRCAACGAVYIADAARDLKSLYPEDYLAFGDPSRRSARALNDRIVALIDATRWTKILRTYGVSLTKETRFADVGCGDPWLLRAMVKLGYKNLTGIDPYVPARVDTSGITMLRRTIDAIANAGEHAAKFDVVMFHHSLEHVPDPAASLRAASKLIAPNGTILIRLPVVNEAWERYREAWWGICAPQHLSIPSERSMQVLAERIGFAISGIVYDSTRMQFLVSEAHERNRSRAEAFPSSPMHKIAVAASTMHLWLRARRLNAQRRGDQAAFVLRRFNS
jgi:2-polyprenyl-3-methyl-5-hydroxy-6-metoxy-1,4-benzoquinol methylase